jgi:hypothetical protein
MIPGDLQTLSTDILKLCGTKLSGILQKHLKALTYNGVKGSKEPYDQPSKRTIIEACNKV